MAFKDETRKKFFLSKVFGKKEKNAVRKYDDPVLNPAYFGGSPLHSPFSSPRIFKTLTDGHIFGDFGSPKNSSVHTEAFRIFVATWNVGGNPPHPGLDLNDFLPSDDHSDIYVLGFQEIVPLNAGSVLVEDNEPAMRWLGLINKALNRPLNSNDPSISPYYHHSPFSKLNSPQSSLTTLLSFDSCANTSNLNISKSSLKEAKRSFNLSHGIRLKSCNCPLGMAHRSNKKSCFLCKKPNMSVSDSSEEEGGDEGSTSFTADDLDFSNTWSHEKYCLVASKQMVGIFLSVWVRKELSPHVSHVRLSSVGRGIMNYLGNKGCISVSMSLHQTSLCFVCSHLASGEKEGDELRRNLDVIEILKHTQFKRICKRSGRRIPHKILDHDRVIWLGDLNYRIALSYYETKLLLEQNNWDALFENDQLKIEREAERVFKGFSEGKIYFAPTYKYSNNSDEYLGDMLTSKKKRRTPAWCDRILWHGDGIVQLSYFRGESRFSDHRPVCAAFIVEVGVLDSKLKKHFSTPNMKVGAEELLS
ncbi:Type I inositol polyphosphate 5-phosphatase 5 [Rhynchospora pubera]|uniref:Type I inositol polyphosphate 5-phosphatase 5 n=1 Tax=Rhynchospora pubera TaxID=906938 RepID=A0AAV8E0N0_9POAL|nr:Type I inositol polyphosphate 5-phosphatase 5 [Rhynchospora pubera]